MIIHRVTDSLTFQLHHARKRLHDAQERLQEARQEPKLHHTIKMLETDVKRAQAEIQFLATAMQAEGLTL